MDKSARVLCLLCAVWLMACTAPITPAAALPSPSAPLAAGPPTATIAALPTLLPTATAIPPPTVTPTSAWPAGMEALGALARKMVENASPPRWEYRGESPAGPAVAYWDGAARRLQLVETVASLDLAEHAGLFVRWAPERVEAAFAASHGKAVPILVDAATGTLCEAAGGRHGIGLGQLPTGSVARSPFRASVAKSGVGSADQPSIVVLRLYDPASGVEVLRVFGSPGLAHTQAATVLAGDMLFETAGVNLAAGNPCGAASELMFTNGDERDPGTRLTDLMRDALGRIVMIGP